jgi:molybdopterin-guanine dinucleotide biosynthesis protein A
MTGVVLAGGRNSRMGRDKASLPWQGSDFLQVILHKLIEICDELIVVTNTDRAEILPNLRYVADIIPQRGPLSGIHAGLVHAASDLVFVTACDMPYLSTAAVNHLRSLSPGWDVVAPGEGECLEPLFACYRKTCIPLIESLLQQDIRKTQTLFPLVRYRQVPLDELKQFDPQLRFLFNINSPSDYQAALREVNLPATVL